MPLIDATWGSSVANSYVTLADANSFLATTLHEPFWTALAKTDKEILILTATRSIDSRNWSGGRFFLDQVLEFPRSLVEPFPRGTDPSTFSIEWRDMIKRVKEATSIQAVWEHLRRSETDYRLIQAQGISSISQGGGNTNTSVSFSSFARVLHPDASSILKDWKADGPRVFRG